jgi:ribonucleoside-diphosphate reductase alpha chain
MLKVVKHDGSLEDLDLSKASASLMWAIGDLTGVSLSDIEVQSNLHFFDGIHTSYITDIFIKTCDDLADLRHPNYDAVARNLKLQRLYKQVFESINPPSLIDFLGDRVLDGHYSVALNPVVLICKGIDMQALEQTIDHKRDFTFTSSGLDALVNGYGVCKFETPQFMFMAIAIDIFRDYHIDPTRYIIDFYNALSTYRITLPTPEMKSLRTTSTDYASCIIFRMGDTIDSWKAASNALVDHTCASAGVGVDIADISSIGDSVKNGKVTHSGKLPFITPSVLSFKSKS